MDNETLEALQGSIVKWEGIVAGKRRDGGVDDCPLCRIFWAAFDCRGCPVREKSGEVNCRCTPYADFAVAKRAGDKDAMATHAKAELNFLKTLLPAELPAHTESAGQS